MQDISHLHAPHRSAWCRGTHKKAPPATRQHARQRIRELRAVAASIAETGSLTLFSPSKINLFLRILGKREDGFHDLASLFQVIDLGDTLDFKELRGASEDRLTCNVADIPTDSSNLVLRALDLFRMKTGKDQRFRVHLEKRVPHGAGLGGGSGNAATALWAANALCGRPASDAQLLQWSGEIGSDISVFFSRGTAYCTGRGEIVEPCDSPVPDSTPLLLVKPPMPLATAAIFRALDLASCDDSDPRELLHGLADAKLLPRCCVNDLEPPAFQTLPELAELKRRLAEDSDGAFSAVFMTGSGSTIVGLGSSMAPQFLDGPEYAGHFVSGARTISRRPGQWYEQQPARTLAMA